MAERGEISELSASPLEDTEDGLRTARHFEVTAYSAVDAKALLRQRKGITRGVPFVSYQGEVIDYSLVCRGITAGPKTRDAPIGGLASYLVNAVYENRRGGSPEPAIGGPPVYRIETTLVSVPADLDKDGDPIVTASGEPVDPPLTNLSADEVLVVEWWVTAGNVLEVLKSMRVYRNGLNASDWHTAPRGCVLCEGIRNTDEVEVDGGRVAVKLSGRFQYRPPIVVADLPVKVLRKPSAGVFSLPYSVVTGTLEGFTRLVPNRGTRKFNADVEPPSSPYERIMDSQGRYITEPVDFDEAGAYVAVGGQRSVIAYELKRRYVELNDLGV